MMLNYEVMIRTMNTPNPFAYKFIANGPFKSNGKATFNSAQEAQGILLIENLFQLPEILQIHLFENVMTVTFKEDTDIDESIEKVTAIVQTRLPVHNPNFLLPDEKESKKRKENLSPEMQEIEDILDRTIRPGLQADGGDLEIISYNNNLLTISYEGACGTCPSSMYGTLDAIQSILRHEFNPELEVTIY